jgi:3-hydroxyacyl-CoA dehydrogenase
MKFCVVGAGTMGSGIAQMLVTNGFETVICDLDTTFVERSKANISKALYKLVQKDKLEKDKADEALQRLVIGQSLAYASECNFIIEAVVENVDVKKRVFSELSKICLQEAILATNASSISITEIASSTIRPDKVVGMHFFNPVHAMKLVEVIRGAQTSQDTFESTFRIVKEFGKEPIEVNEAPGFVVNRILIPMLNEAISVYAEGVASAVDIDKAMVLGANHPLGPLSLADLIGLDTVLAIMRVLVSETGDSKYRPHPLLIKMVRSGKLGRKTGEGFFKYDV